MKTNTKIKSFIKQFIASVQGDSAKASAQRNFRLANSAYEIQIALVKGEIVRLEAAVLIAEENDKKALSNNGYEITGDGTGYIELQFQAAKAVSQAKENLIEAQERLEFLQGRMALINQEVSEEESAS